MSGDPVVPRLAVCVTCRAGREPQEDEPRPGRALYEALAARAAAPGGPDVELVAVECLSLCDRGCAAAISGGGKWSYLLGRLDPDKADDLLSYAQAYAASKTGLVLPSRRAASLADMVQGRMPPAVWPPEP